MLHVSQSLEVDSNAEPLQIYTSATCGWAIRNYAVLLLKEVSFSLIKAYDETGKKTKEFEEISPYAKTPTLLADGLAIGESLIINEYLEERYPTPALMPATAEERAEARLWMYHCDGVLFATFGRLLKSEGEEQERQARVLEKELARLAEWYESGPQVNPFFGGQEIGLVDISYFTFFDSLNVPFAEEVLGKIEIKPSLQRWRDAIVSHPTMLEAASFMGRI